MDIRARSAQRRQQPGDQSGHQRGRGRVTEHAPIHVEFHAQGKIARQRDAGEQPADPCAHGRADHASEQGQQQALGEHLPHQTGAPRPHGGADGDFLVAHAGPGEQQVDHVYAGHQQHESHETQEHGGDDGHLVGVGGTGARQMLRNHIHLVFLVRVPILLSEAICDDLKGSLRRRPAHSWLQAAEHIERVEVALGEQVFCPGVHGSHAQGEIGLSLGKKEASMKCCLNHADDGARAAIDAHGLSDHCGVASEPAPPVFVSEHDHRVCPRILAFFGQDQPSQHGLDSQEAEVIPGDEFGPGALGVAIGAETHEIRIDGGQLLEGIALRAIALEIEVGDAVGPLILRVRIGQHHELLPILDRQGAQQERVDHAEQRRISANAQRQRNHGYGCESGALPEQTRSVPYVLQQCVHLQPPRMVTGACGLVGRGTPQEPRSAEAAETDQHLRPAKFETTPPL